MWFRYGGCAWETFWVCRARLPWFSNLRTAATPSLGNECGSLTSKQGFAMLKVEPNPPDTDRACPYEPDSKKISEAAEQALDFHFPSTADIKATPRTPSNLFTVDPEATTETLVVYLVETLASVDVMVHQLVDHLDGESRNALLGISNSVMLAEITANRVLDQIDPPE
jgi:hypothetical protein